MKKKLIAAVAALALVASVGAGATLAYLTDSTQAVTNTFTVGKVDISLDEDANKLETAATVTKQVSGNETIGYETIGYDFTHVQPGDTYKKQPTVYVEAGSEACYVFVKINDSTNGVLTYEVDTPWVQYTENGTAVAGVYYTIVEKYTEAGKSFDVFKDDQVVVSTAVTENLAKLGEIKLKAAAVQKANVETLADAYKLVAGKLQ